MAIEASLSARAAPVPSIVTVLVAVALSAVVLLTSGRSVAASRAVLERIDSAQPRIVTVTDTTGAGNLDPSLVDRVRGLAGVSEVVALSSVTEVANPKFPNGDPIGLYTAWGDLPDTNSILIGRPPGTGEVIIDQRAQELLRMGDGIGEVMGDDDLTWPVVATFSTNGVMAGFDYSALRRGAEQVEDSAAMSTTSTTESPVIPVMSVRVLAKSTDDVPRVARAIGTVMGAEDPTGLRVATSGDFGVLRDAISGDLGRFGRGLVFLVLMGGIVMGTLNTSALILMRRRDLGRRRALGATRSMLISILLVQSALPSLVGGVIGCVGGVIALEVAHDPIPELAFYPALVFLILLTSVTAALGPSIGAALRDPIKVLRQP